MIFTLKTVLYLSVVLWESTGQATSMWCDSEENKDLIVPTVAFFTAVHWVCFASKQHVSPRFTVVLRERNLLCFFRLHISLEPKRSLCVQYLFFSLPALFLGVGRERVLLSPNFELQIEPVVKMANRGGSLYLLLYIVIWHYCLKNIVNQMKLEAVEVIRIQSSFENRLKI